MGPFKVLLLETKFLQNFNIPQKMKRWNFNMILTNYDGLEWSRLPLVSEKNLL